MLSLYIYDTKRDEEFSKYPILKFSAVAKPPQNTISNLKDFIVEMKENPYRFKIVLQAECLGTLRMADNMAVMNNFAKAVLFFNEESTDKNEYLKMFGSLVALAASEGATVND